MEFNLSDIQHIFEADNDTKSAEVGEEVSLLTDNIENFRFEKLGVAKDRAIIYAISGYIARNLIKNRSKCDDCSEFLSPDKVSFHPDIDEVVNTDQVEAREEFVRNITRGGLIKPSDALFVLCVHVSMYTFIINAENHKEVLLATSNPRSVFVGTFIQKLDENENTRVIL